MFVGTDQPPSNVTACHNALHSVCRGAEAAQVVRLQMVLHVAPQKQAKNHGMELNPKRLSAASKQPVLASLAELGKTPHVHRPISQKMNCKTEMRPILLVAWGTRVS